MAEPAVVGQDNGTIQELRARVDELNKQVREVGETNQTLSQQLEEAKREKMTEIERIQSERDEFKNRTADLSQYQSKAEKYEQTMQRQYEARLSSLSDDVRAEVQSLSSVGDWADRVGALEAAVGLMAKVKPTKAGTNTDPGATPPPATPPTDGGKKPDEDKSFDPKVGITSALSQRRA